MWGVGKNRSFTPAVRSYIPNLSPTHRFSHHPPSSYCHLLIVHPKPATRYPTLPPLRCRSAGSTGASFQTLSEHVRHPWRPCSRRRRALALCLLRLAPIDGACVSHNNHHFARPHRCVRSISAGRTGGSGMVWFLPRGSTSVITSKQ